MNMSMMHCAPLSSFALMTALLLSAGPVVAQEEQAAGAKGQDETMQQSAQRQQPQASEQAQASKQALQREADETMATLISVSVPVYEVTPGQVAASPGPLYGNVVQVTGEVEDIVGPRSFTLDEERLGAGPDVMVITPRPMSASIPEDETVTVIGHLRPLVRAEFERDYGWFDWDGGTEIEIETSTRPALIATSIITEDGLELLVAE